MFKKDQKISGMGDGRGTSNTQACQPRGHMKCVYKMNLRALTTRLPINEYEYYII